MPSRERKQTEVFKPEVKEPVKRVKKPAAPKAKVEKAAKAEKKEKVDKPKKANAFMMFSNANRADVIKKNPDAGFGEVGKLIGLLWGKLKESDKADWKKKGMCAFLRLSISNNYLFLVYKPACFGSYMMFTWLSCLTRAPLLLYVLPFLYLKFSLHNICIPHS